MNFTPIHVNVKSTAEEIIASPVLKDIIPIDMDAEVLATLITKLNANSHQLENLGGSGLFLTALLMEHNCR